MVSAFVASEELGGEKGVAPAVPSGGGNRRKGFGTFPAGDCSDAEWLVVLPDEGRRRRSWRVCMDGLFNHGRNAELVDEGVVEGSPEDSFWWRLLHRRSEEGVW